MELGTILLIVGACLFVLAGLFGIAYLLAKRKLAQIEAEQQRLKEIREEQEMVESVLADIE